MVKKALMQNKQLIQSIYKRITELYYVDNLKSGPLSLHIHTHLKNSNLLNQHRKITEYMTRTITTTPSLANLNIARTPPFFLEKFWIRAQECSRHMKGTFSPVYDFSRVRFLLIPLCTPSTIIQCMAIGSFIHVGDRLFWIGVW